MEVRRVSSIEVELAQLTCTEWILGMLDYARMDERNDNLKFYARLVNTSVGVFVGNSNISSLEIIAYLDECRRLLGKAYSSSFHKKSVKRNLLLPAFRHVYNKSETTDQKFHVQAYLQRRKVPFVNVVDGKRGKGRRNSSAPDVYYYSGQFSKAVYLWTSQLISGTNDRSFRAGIVRSIFYTLIKAHQLSEICHFLNWTFLRFGGEEEGVFKDLVDAFLEFLLSVNTKKMSDSIKAPSTRFFIVSNRTLSLIHISEPTRQAEISYAVFCLKKMIKTRKERVVPLASWMPLTRRFLPTRCSNWTCPDWFSYIPRVTCVKTCK